MIVVDVIWCFMWLFLMEEGNSIDYVGCVGLCNGFENVVVFVVGNVE